MRHDFKERAARVKLFLMDCDGVLTDGRVWNVPTASGEMFETKGFDTQDGIALQWLNWNNIATGVISGRVSQATETRAQQVGMTYVYQGHIEKIPILEDILAKSGIAAENVAYMGDDLTDVPIMRRVGFALAPANARREVRDASNYVTAASGGGGAVREACELILRAQRLWEDILKKYQAL